MPPSICKPFGKPNLCAVQGIKRTIPEPQTQKPIVAGGAQNSLIAGKQEQARGQSQPLMLQRFLSETLREAPYHNIASVK